MSRRTVVLLPGRHLDDHLVVHLEDQPARGRPVLEVMVQADQGHLEDVGRQPLDPGVHRLALGRLADPVVGRRSSGSGRMRPNAVRVSPRTWASATVSSM